MLRWWLELRWGDGKPTYPLAPMPGDWFVANWREVEAVIEHPPEEPDLL